MLVQTRDDNYINLTRGHITRAEDRSGNFKVLLIPHRAHTEHLIGHFHEKEDAQKLMDEVVEAFVLGRKLFRRS